MVVSASKSGAVLPKRRVGIVVLESQIGVDHTWLGFIGFDEREMVYHVAFLTPCYFK